MKHVLVVFSIILFSGCASVDPIRLYEGEARGKSVTSELVVFNLCPTELDGKALNAECNMVSRVPLVFEVEPGKHKLKVVYEANGNYKGPILDAVLDKDYGPQFSEEIDMKAGFKYFVTPDLYGLTIVCEGLKITEMVRN
jgi:hypothetical protein